MGPDSLASRKPRRVPPGYGPKATGVAGEFAEGETKEADDEARPRLGGELDVEEATGKDEKEPAKLEELN